MHRQYFSTDACSNLPNDTSLEVMLHLYKCTRTFLDGGLEKACNPNPNWKPERLSLASSSSESQKLQYSKKRIIITKF